MRPSRHATVIAWTIFAVLLSPIIATAGFSDNLSDFDRPARPVSLRTGSDPNVSRLFFMPTFEVAPQGQTSVGTTELVAVHGSFSPLDFAQIGISTIPWLPGSVSVGAKVLVYPELCHACGGCLPHQRSTPSRSWPRTRRSRSPSGS